MSKQKPKESITDALKEMPSRQTSLRCRLTDDQWAEVIELAEMMAKRPQDLQRIGWKAIAEKCKNRWGLEKLAASTLERQICQICDEQKK